MSTTICNQCPAGVCSTLTKQACCDRQPLAGVTSTGVCQREKARQAIKRCQSPGPSNEEYREDCKKIIDRGGWSHIECGQRGPLFV